MYMTKFASPQFTLKMSLRSFIVRKCSSESMSMVESVQLKLFEWLNLLFFVSAFVLIWGDRRTTKKHIRNENIFTNLFHCSDSQCYFLFFWLEKIVWFFVCYINLIVARFIILLPGLYTTTQKVESCSIKNPIQKVRNIFQTTLSTLPTYLTAKKFSDSSYVTAP